MRLGGRDRRVDREMLRETVWPASEPAIFVCGPTAFVETNVAELLIELGHAAQRVRTERFGPTGT